MVGCVVRAAVAGDLDALTDVRRRASLSNDGDRDNLLAHPELLEFAGDAIADGRTRVAVIDDRVVGFATIVHNGDVDDLDDLFVDPDWMRQGIGLALVGDVVARAREHGARYVEVTANQHALLFYERAGFVAGLRADVATKFRSAPRLVLDVRRQKLEGSNREKFSKK